MKESIFNLVDSSYLDKTSYFGLNRFFNHLGIFKMNKDEYTNFVCRENRTRSPSKPVMEDMS